MLNIHNVYVLNTSVQKLRKMMKSGSKSKKVQTKAKIFETSLLIKGKIFACRSTKDSVVSWIRVVQGCLIVKG